jgi:hypothetical protein
MSTTRSLIFAASNKTLSIPKITKDDALVTFHELCDNCEGFFRSWDVIDAVQSSSALPDRSYEHIVLCTLAHILRARAVCHLCALLLKALQLFPNRSLKGRNDERVYLRAVESNDSGCVVLQVVLGRNAPPADDERRDGAAFFLRKFSCKKISLFAHESCNLPSIASASSDAFQQHITTKQTHLLARENLHIAKGWIKTCLADHQRCRTFQQNTVSPHEMPTRILEVSEDKIRLRCDMTNKPFEYLVLSHMWGDNHSQQLLLENDNIEDFQKDIPMHKLANSATFREAIRVTRALGYCYIWIDSLCIVQNSKSDWDHEASRMATVYGNAVCNIACLFPPNNDRQPTTREDPRVWHPCILRDATTSQPGVYIEQVNKSWILSSERDGRDWLMQDRWPLFKRAWQEPPCSQRKMYVTIPTFV